MTVSVLLSMWISNSGVTAMLIPIVDAVVDELFPTVNLSQHFVARILNYHKISTPIQDEESGGDINGKTNGTVACNLNMIKEETGQIKWRYV